MLSNFGAIVALLAASSFAFYDAGDATIPTTTPAYVPTVPHHLLPTSYEPWTKARPSMITAIAPSMALMGHGVPILEYSVHFNNPAAAGHQHGHGLFKRGVFASDPPLSTCQQCDSNGRPSTTPNTIDGTGFTSTPCSTIPYSVSLKRASCLEILMMIRVYSARLLHLQAFASTRITQAFSSPPPLHLHFHVVHRHRSHLHVLPILREHQAPSAVESSSLARLLSVTSRPALTHKHRPHRYRNRLPGVAAVVAAPPHLLPLAQSRQP